MAGVPTPCASSSESLGPTSGWPEHEGAPHGLQVSASILAQIPRSPSSRRLASRRLWTRVLVAIAPWMLASGIATATMSTELAPRADETELPQMQSPPPPPPAAQPGHSGADDVYFDPTELIAV